MSRMNVAVLTLFLAACAGDETAKDAASTQTTADSTTGMAGMPGMDSSATGKMIDDMREQLRIGAAASADSLKAMIPTHRQAAANLIAEMNREMKEMQMASDSSWNATVDSIRADLTLMPDMAATEIKSIFPAHATRLTRVMDTHAQMMKH